MSKDLEGKVALITGVGGGQGRTAALRFAAAGATIVGCDVQGDNTEETCRKVRDAGGRMTGSQVDLTDPKQARKWVDDAAAAHNGFDILYNNASRGWFSPMGQFPIEDWDSCIRSELNIIFYVTEPAWPHLQKKGGVIINTGSVAGMQGSGPGGAAHAAAKGGVIALTQHLAQEGAAYKIRCVCISPGYIITPGTAFVQSSPLHQQLVDRTLVGRAGQPEDIAELALFLASDKASFITGVNYAVDGGQLLGGYFKTN
jgi:meso-butanediol dehydrogenase / (S,S)-butanediol dehydrogenase / diacetyl reductase